MTVSWDIVRRLICQFVAPAAERLGFGPHAGATMYRERGPFLDVINFRCHKWADRAAVAFGCDLASSARRNPKPWHCAFELQHFRAWSEDALSFQASEAEQIRALERFRPLFVDEVNRWFGILADLETARRAAEHNDPDGPHAVGLWSVPSPAAEEVLRRLQAEKAGS